MSVPFGSQKNALGVAAPRAFFCADCLFVLLLIFVQPLADVVCDYSCCDRYKKRNEKFHPAHLLPVRERSKAAE